MHSPIMPMFLVSFPNIHKHWHSTCLKNRKSLPLKQILHITLSNLLVFHYCYKEYRYIGCSQVTTHYNLIPLKVQVFDRRARAVFQLLTSSSRSTNMKNQNNCNYFVLGTRGSQHVQQHLQHKHKISTII